MRILIATLLAVLLCSAAYAENMVIKLKSGEVYSIETSKIQSITFSDGGLTQQNNNTDGNVIVRGYWYDTSNARYAVVQNGNEVRSTYTVDNGVLKGTLYGDTMDVIWIEDNSNRRCSTPQEGRYYWGRAVFKFVDGKLKGYYGYCNDAPSPNYPWELHRKQ